MKKFLIRTAGIVFGAVFMFLLINAVYYKYANHSRQVAFEVYEAIDEAGVNNGYTKLVLGDSVARQIFSPKYQSESDEICYMATNQAVMTAGNYILLERFIENNPQLDEVYYVARPDSLMGGANFVYTYSYFITPFYNESFIQYLEPETRAEMEMMFGRLGVKREFFKWLFGKYPKLLDIYQSGCESILQIRMRCGGVDEEDTPALYLRKIKESCEEKNITFHLLAPPLPETYQYSLEEMGKRLAFEDDAVFAEYLDSIMYVEDDEFVDGVHLEDAYLEQMREKIRTNLLF